MKVKINQKGVFDANGKPVPVGKTLTVKGDKMPGYLVGKAVEVEAAPKKEPVVNPAKEPASNEGGGD
jgi:hypothetical protein